MRDFHISSNNFPVAYSFCMYRAAKLCFKASFPLLVGYCSASFSLANKYMHTELMYMPSYICRFKLYCRLKYNFVSVHGRLLANFLSSTLTQRSLEETDSSNYY